MCWLFLFGFFESLVNLDLPDEPLGELGYSSPCSHSENCCMAVFSLYWHGTSTNVTHPKFGCNSLFCWFFLVPFKVMYSDLFQCHRTFLLLSFGLDPQSWFRSLLVVLSLTEGSIWTHWVAAKHLVLNETWKHEQQNLFLIKQVGQNNIVLTLNNQINYQNIRPNSYQ